MGRASYNGKHLLEYLLSIYELEQYNVFLQFLLKILNLYNVKSLGCFRRKHDMLNTFLSMKWASYDQGYLYNSIHICMNNFKGKDIPFDGRSLIIVGYLHQLSQR
jgi:hypothetical protein